MSTKINKLKLENYCGYRKTELDFTDKQGNALPLSVFYGPNGSGKSSVLNAIRLLTSPQDNLAKNTSMAFRKLTYDPDMAVDYLKFKQHQYSMTIEGFFNHDNQEKSVCIKTSGVEKSGLPRKLHGHSYYIDADNPANMRRFQVLVEKEKDFLELAKVVYGYDCKLERRVDDEMRDPVTEKVIEKISVYTDLVITKPYVGYEDTRVHFKSMSDGERKIATLLQYLFDPCYMDSRQIILIDNVEMHVYYKRHAAMIDCLLKKFPDKQFLVTTHSGTLINHVSAKYGKEHLIDLEEIRSGAVSLNEWAY